MTEPVPDKKPEYLATATPEVDFALVLARVIDDVNRDPAELRRAVYELARIKLQREGWRHDPPLDIGEMRKLTKALETAIERVEAFSSQRDEARVLRSLDRLIKDQERGEPRVIADPTLLALENGAEDASASQFYNDMAGGSADITTVSSEAAGTFAVATPVSAVDSYGNSTDPDDDPEGASPVAHAYVLPPAGLTDRLARLWQEFASRRASAGERMRLGGSPLARTLVV